MAGVVRSTRTVGAAAPGMGSGKEVVILSAGMLVVFILLIAATRLLRRLRRYLRELSDRREKARNQKDKWNKFCSKNRGPGGR